MSTTNNQHEHISSELVSQLEAHGVTVDAIDDIPLFSLIYRLGVADERHLAAMRATALNARTEVQAAAAAVA